MNHRSRLQLKKNQSFCIWLLVSFHLVIMEFCIWLPGKLAWTFFWNSTTNYFKYLSHEPQIKALTCKEPETWAFTSSCWGVFHLITGSFWTIQTTLFADKKVEFVKVELWNPSTTHTNPNLFRKKSNYVKLELWMFELSKMDLYYGVLYMVAMEVGMDTLFKIAQQTAFKIFYKNHR